MGDSRFDRQIRLWGQAGQRRLEDARCCVCGVTLAAIEVAKNVILAGVGECLIISHPDDLRRPLPESLLILASSTGSCSEAIVESLQGFNPSVKDPLGVGQSFYEAFDLVVSTVALKPPAGNYILLGPSSFCPIISSAIVWDPRQDHPMLDLRLDEPFEALQSLLSKFSAGSLKAMDGLLPLPMVLVLLRQQNTGSRDDGELFSQTCRSFILSLGYSSAELSRWLPYARQRSKGVAAQFLEQVAKLKGLGVGRGQKHYREALCCLAIERFVRLNKGLLPVNPELPDMECSWLHYQEFAQVYKQKAEADLRLVIGLVREILCERQEPVDLIPDTEISEVCMLANRLAVLVSNESPGPVVRIEVGDRGGHVEAAILGGLVAQEALKLLTQTFIPLANKTFKLHELG